jgi:hypothetical protein
MNPNTSELDQRRRSIGQVESPPEPEPNDPEKPNGDQEVTDNEDLAN